MTKPRKEQVCLDATPYYYCYVRCVRWAYLCGEDCQTGENYGRRKQWMQLYDGHIRSLCTAG